MWPMITAVPKAAPTALPELDTYLAPFTALFRRRWSRERLERSITGLLTDLPHKTCDTIAGAVAGILCTGKCFTFLSPGFSRP